MAKPCVSLPTAVLVTLCTPLGALSEAPRGSFTFASESACLSDKRFTGKQCHTAAINSQAEFDEKSPRYPTRSACEAVLGPRRCSLGFAAGGVPSGTNRGVYFTPQQSGFRIVVRSENDMSVVPLALSPFLTFQTRTILRPQITRNPRVHEQAEEAFKARTGSELSSPEAGLAGPLPPPPPNDPNFDCASVIEQKNGENPATGCYPLPASRAHHE